MINSPHGLQHMSTCMSTLAVLPKSLCRITAALPWIATRVGRISGSMLSIRKWLNTMALQSYQPASGPLATKQMPRAV